MGRNSGVDTAEAEGVMAEMDQMDSPDTDTTGHEATEATEAVETDSDAGFTIVDDMKPAAGETSFSVTKKTEAGNFKGKLAYNFGTDLASMTEIFGEKIVYEFALANMIVKGQAVCRSIVGKGQSAESALKAWVPGVKRVAAPVDPKVEASKFVANAGLDELEAMMAEIEAAKNAL